MITENKRIRFCENNFIDSNTILNYSSQDSNFPFSNICNDERSKVWKPTGYFEITSSNNKLYINDGSNKTITIAANEYTTGALLAADIESFLNLSSSGWHVSYSNSRFTVTNDFSYTIRFSVLTNSIARTLGFTGSVDLVCASLTSDVNVIHTSEYCIFDLGFAASVDFIAILGNVDEIFPLSNSAIITAYGNNINDFDSPAFTKTLTRYDGGVFNFIDDTDANYRYWKIKIVDPQNTLGSPGLSFSNIYLGDYQTLESRNLENGFSITFNDKSTKYESESGALFFDKKPKFKTIEGTNLGFLSRADRKMFDSMFQKLGLSTPFYVSIDPQMQFTDDLDELTKFVVFNSEPNYRHIIRDIFSIAVSFRECV